MQLWTDLCDQKCSYAAETMPGNARKQLETILCQFGQIYAVGNALKLLETILCKFERIYAVGYALTLLENVLCEFATKCLTISIEPLAQTLPKNLLLCGLLFDSSFTHGHEEESTLLFNLQVDSKVIKPIGASKLKRSVSMYL